MHVARVEPPADWRAMVVMPGDPVATSHARAVLPATYSRADAVANIQAAALLGLAFAQGRADLLRPAMADRIHQPYREEICPLLPRLLPLVGKHGIAGVALSGAGPSVLLILAGGVLTGGETEKPSEDKRSLRSLEHEPTSPAALESAIEKALGDACRVEILTVEFETKGAGEQ